MADVKISALPAATTPLAGTEVLPIVQSATTKQVSIANVTAGRAISASSLTLTTPLSVANGGTGLTSLTAGYIPYGNGTGAFSSGSGLYSSGSTLVLGSSSAVTAAVFATKGVVGIFNGQSDGAQTVANAGLLFGNSNGWSSAGIWPIGSAGFAGSLAFGVVPSGSGTYTVTEAMRIASDGSVGIGTSSPSQKLDVNGAIAIGGTKFFSKIGGNSYYWNNTSNSYWVDSTGNTVQMALDASGNLGLGVTPSAWFSNRKALQIGGSVGVVASSGLNFDQYCNGYIDASTVERYYQTGAATKFSSDNGVFKWFNAASGSANAAISFTQAMTLDASGFLGVGETSPSTYGARILAANSSDCAIRVRSSSGEARHELDYYGAGGYGSFQIYRDNVRKWRIGVVNDTSSSPPLQFWKEGTGEVARIDSSGNFNLGITGVSDRFALYYTRASQQGITIKPSADTGAGNAVLFQNASAGTVGTISTTSSATTYATSSDIALKNNIAPANSSLASILAFPVDQFDWKADGSHTDYGCVAQKAIAYAPEIVVQGDIWSVDYGRITPRLIKAFQELAAKVSALEAKQ